MASVNDIKRGKGVRAEAGPAENPAPKGSPLEPVPIPPHIKGPLQVLLNTLEAAQASTVTAYAALKYQGADYDEDIAFTLQRNVGDRLDDAIHRLERLLYPHSIDSLEETH